MKKVIYLFASMAMVALFSLSACKKDKPAGDQPEMRKALELTVGQTFDLTVKNYTGEVTWATSDAATVSLDAAQKGTKITVKAEKTGKANVTATCGTVVLTCAVTVVDEVPDIDAPDAQHAKIAIKIPEGTDCYGITFHGSLSQAAWTQADWEFEELTEAPGWWVAEVDIASEADSYGSLCYGKPCLWQEDGTISQNWGSQWTSGSIVKGEDIAIIGIPGDEANKIGFQASGVVYIIVAGWQDVPCAGKTEFTIKVKTPVCAEIDPVQICGSFTDWGGKADVDMEWNPSTNYWEGEVELTAAGAQFKFRANSSWDYEIKAYNEATGEWNSLDNYQITEADFAAGEVVFDYSDAAMYQWSKCEAPEPFEPNEAQTDVTFTWKGQEGFSLAEGDKLCFTGNFEDQSWADSQREMTDNGDGTYSWTGDIPAAFECKIIIHTAGGSDVWGDGSNVKLSSTDTYPFAFDMSIPY